MAHDIRQLIAYHEDAVAKLRAALPIVEAGPVPLDTPPAAPGAPMSRAVDTAAVLALFHRHRPIRNGELGGNQNRIAVLVRHGYIKRKGDGYVRTAKEWKPRA